MHQRLLYGGDCGMSGVTLAGASILPYARSCACMTLAQLYRGPRRAPELAAFALGGPQAPGTSYGSYGSYAVGARETATIAQRVEQAALHEHRGEWRAAEAMYRAALKVQEGVNGCDDPTALLITAGIVRAGFAQHRSGPQSQVVRDARDVALAQFVDVFGHQHPHTVALRNAR